MNSFSTGPAPDVTPDPGERLQVLLVDDHPAVRLGTRGLIREAHEQTDIREAGDAQEAMRLLAEHRFHAVFLDLGIPSAPGALPNSAAGKELLKAVRERDDGPPVVVMSGEIPTPSLTEEMIAMGAATFVPKSAAIEIQLDAIRRALAGGVWLPPEMVGKGGTVPPPSGASVSGPLPAPITHLDLGITPRDFEVLRLALSGLTPAKIALTLDINATNVRRKMVRLYEKFGTANQASLHAYFARTGQTLGILQSLPKARRQ
jgi:DNA-binding NarL/FixJ family response regulator